MTTSSRACEVCERRFVVTRAHKLTCSDDCWDVLARRRERHRKLVAWSLGPPPTAPEPPHRIGEALADTLAAVARLQAEGRRLARAS